MPFFYTKNLNSRKKIVMTSKRTTWLLLCMSMSCNAMEQWALERRSEKEEESISSINSWGNDSWIWIHEKDKAFQAISNQPEMKELSDTISRLEKTAQIAGANDVLKKIDTLKKEFQEAIAFKHIYSGSDSEEEWNSDEEEGSTVEELLAAHASMTSPESRLMQHENSHAASKAKKRSEQSILPSYNIPQYLTPLVDLGSVELPFFASPQVLPSTMPDMQVPQVDASSLSLQQLMLVSSQHRTHHAPKYDMRALQDAYRMAEDIGLELPSMQDFMTMQQVMQENDQHQQEEYFHNAYTALELMDSGEREVARLWLNLEEARACGMISEDKFNRKCEKLLIRVVRGDFAITTPKMKQLQQYCRQVLEQQHELESGQQELAYPDHDVQIAHNILVAGGRNNHIAYPEPAFLWHDEQHDNVPELQIPHFLQSAQNNLAQLRLIAEQSDRARAQQLLLLEAGNTQEAQPTAIAVPIADQHQQFDDEILANDKVIPIVSSTRQQSVQQSVSQSAVDRNNNTPAAVSSNNSNFYSSGGGSAPMMLPTIGSRSGSSVSNPSSDKHWCAQECCLGVPRWACIGGGVAAAIGIVGGVLLCKTHCPGKCFAPVGPQERLDLSSRHKGEQGKEQQKQRYTKDDFEWPADWNNAQKEEYVRHRNEQNKGQSLNPEQWWKSLDGKKKLEILSRILMEYDPADVAKINNLPENERYELFKDKNEEWENKKIEELKNRPAIEWWKGLKPKDHINIVNKALSELTPEQRLEYFSTTEQGRLETLKEKYVQWLQESENPYLSKDRSKIVITKEQHKKEQDAYWKSQQKEQQKIKEEQQAARRKQIEQRAADKVDIEYAGNYLTANDKARFVDREVNNMLAQDEANMKWWRDLNPKDQIKLVSGILAEPGVQESWWNNLSEQDRINELKRFNNNRNKSKSHSKKK